MDEYITAFASLLGQDLKFYGVDNNNFKLGKTVWLAIENESDGYRSYLGSIETVGKSNVNLIFFKRPLATVRVKHFDDYYSRGFELMDVSDGHIWLRVGTSNYDDCYPCFLFEYNPKNP